MRTLQFHGSNVYVEPWFLYRQAHSRLSEGGAGITLRLIERIVVRTPIGPQWGIFQSYAQGLRIALRRFAEVAEIDIPANLPIKMRSFLLQTQGWGLVMIGDAPRADKCFALARSFMEIIDHNSREYLYLLNISALCLLKMNDIAGALAMEKRIEEGIARLPYQTDVCCT